MITTLAGVVAESAAEARSVAVPPGMVVDVGATDRDLALLAQHSLAAGQGLVVAAQLLFFLLSIRLLPLRISEQVRWTDKLSLRLSLV